MPKVKNTIKGVADKHPTISMEKWVSPMLKSFERGTAKWRKEVINLQPQVIVLSQSALTKVDTAAAQPDPVKRTNVLGTGEEGSTQDSKKLGIELRRFAAEWVSKRRRRGPVEEQIYLFNQRNIKGGKFHYILVKNWGMSEKFFAEAKAKGLLKKGNLTHRGHDTAAIRYHTGSELAKLQGFAERGSEAQSAVREAAAGLKRDMQNLVDSITPTLSIGQLAHIDRELKAEGLTDIIILVPQTSAMNWSDNQERWARDQRKGIIKKFLDKWAKDVINIPGSKTFSNALNETINDMLMDKPKKVYRVKKQKKYKAKRKKIAMPAVAHKAPPALRTSKGQFTSAMNIQAILDNRIKQQVQDNMGEGGALVNRTGRFAQSVSVEKVMQSRQGTLTAYYTYMKAPYQTFERGYAQGTARRDPRKLIAASIREIARETLNHKLQIRTRRV